MDSRLLDSGARRLNPRIWDSDYVLLKRIRESLESALVKYVHPLGASTKLVDYGCGDLPYKKLVERYVSMYIACDLEGNKLADLHPDQDGRLPLDSASIDVVMSIQVLEHVSDVESYLSECNRLLKEGGLLILSTHGWWTHHPYPQDLRRWTYEGLKYELGRFGFRVEKNYWMIGMLAYSSQLRIQCVKGILGKRGRFATAFLNIISTYYQISMMLMDKITPSEVAENNAANYLLVATKK